MTPSNTCGITFPNFLQINNKMYLNLSLSVFNSTYFSFLKSISKSGVFKLVNFNISGSGVLSFEDNTLIPKL